MCWKGRFLGWIRVIAVVTSVTACGDDDGLSLDRFLPPLPAPDGTAQSVWAGAITTANAATETIPGPATGGLVGDYYMKNSRARFVIQAPSRFVGVNPYGGTVLDAALRGEDGADVTVDQLGEVGFLYLVGRTCEYDTVDEIVDGAGGGAAAIRMRGHSAVNDWINLFGIGILPVPDDLDPDVEDEIQCAVTYILRPDSPTLEIAWTLWNAGDARVRGPFATFSDAGGEVAQWAPGLGFHRLFLSDLQALTSPSAAPYQAIVGPGVLYGLAPRHAPEIPNASTDIQGVAILLYGASALLDILGPENWILDLEPDAGTTFDCDLTVGTQPSDIDAVYRARLELPPPTPVSGTVAFAPSGIPGAGARVAAFTDADGDGAVGAEDPVVSWFDVDVTGGWSGALAPGSYLLRADVPDVSRSAAVPFTVGESAATAPAVELPDLGRIDFTIADADGGAPVPGLFTVVGVSPIDFDRRVHPRFDRRFGIVTTAMSIYGTSDPAVATDPADAPLLLPPGGPYRVFVSRGPEWTIDSRAFTLAAGETRSETFSLKRVVDTTGYVATEFHQHSMGSPDSSTSYDDRLRSLVVSGIEFFASTDHDYVVDYDPLIDELGLRGVIDGVPGVEATPFAWGHFNAFPMTPDLADPSGGAIDWANGPHGRDMLPGELLAALQAKARIVEVNHPRSLGFTFQQYFDVAQLSFDFAGRTYHGAVPDLAPYLRQPETNDVFSDDFDTLELWQAFSPADSNRDGWREVTKLDLALRDWMNFLSFGRIFTPIGNSDTHFLESEPAGIPRSLVRVGDDSTAGILGGVDEDVYATLLGEGVPRDVVVTNGPMIRLFPNLLGQVVDGTAGTITFDVEVESPEWIGLDTVEVFVNSTYDPVEDEVTALQPLKCWTDRTALMATDPCMTAPMPPDTLGSQVTQGRRHATLTVTLAVADIPNRAGAVGQDAWIVVKASGERAVFPVLTEGALNPDNLEAVVAASSDSELAAALGRVGVPAAAFTAPILVDFDGSGWRAPFAP
jgi:hypothetical protein